MNNLEQKQDKELYGELELLFKRITTDRLIIIASLAHNILEMRLGGKYMSFNWEEIVNRTKKEK